MHEITGIEKSKLRYYLKHGYHFAYTKHELLPFASGLTDCKNDTKTKPIESFQRADAYMVEFFRRLADLASDLLDIVNDINIENYEKLNNGSDKGFSEIDFNNLKREYPGFKNKESIFSDSGARLFFTKLKKSWIAKEVLTIEQKEVLDIFNKKPFAGRLTIEKAKNIYRLSEILRLFADIAKYQEPTFAEYKTFAYTGTWNDFYMYSKGYYNFESKKFRVNNKPKISKSDFQLLENPEFPDKKTELEFYKKISVQIIKVGKEHLEGTIIKNEKEVSNTDIKKIVEYIDFQNELKSSFNVYETNKRKNENKRVKKR